jgi:hypothetical protein
MSDMTIILCRYSQQDRFTFTYDQTSNYLRAQGSAAATGDSDHEGVFIYLRRSELKLFSFDDP